MVRTTECVVDILRRSGPGTLPTARLRVELRRCRPPIILTMKRLRLLVEKSDERLLLMEVNLDALRGNAGVPPLDSWIVLRAPEDAPDYPGMANILWQSLSSLALEVDRTSRVDVTRWVLKAERARRLCALAGGTALGRLG